MVYVLLESLSTIGDGFFCCLSYQLQLECPLARMVIRVTWEIYARCPAAIPATREAHLLPFVGELPAALAFPTLVYIKESLLDMNS